MSTEAQPAGFVKAITRLDATALVVGSMVGSGIFIVSADIARQLGSPGLLLAVWLAAGVTTVMGALTYGELAAAFPTAGGQYVYLREGISPLFGYLYGWTVFMVIQTGTIAAVAVAFARFTAVFLPALSPTVFLGFTVHLPSGPIEVGLSPQRLLAMASVVVLTLVNVRGVRTAALIQTSLTTLKVVSLAALILVGLTIGRNARAIGANFGAHFWPAGGAHLALLPLLGAAMVGALFAMDAWNNVGFASGELKEPRRDLPFAMGAGVLTVTVLYLLANLAYLSVLPLAGIASAPQDRVATAVLQAALGGPGLALMAAAIMIATFGCNNGLILAGARVYYAMARDGLFFRKVSALHPRYQTPAPALGLQAVWTCVLCVSGTYSQLLDYVIFAALLFYVLTGLSLFALRLRRPQLPRPVRVPGYPWLPALYVLMTAAIAVDLLLVKPRYTWPGLAIVALGVPVYFAWRWVARRGRARSALPLALIAVALAHPRFGSAAAMPPARPLPPSAQTMHVGGVALRLSLDAAQFSGGSAPLLDWIERSMRIVSAYYGRFPVTALRLVVVPVPGDRVRGGTTFGQPRALIVVRVGRAVSDAALRDDWVLVHEMTHLALPDVGAEHAWLSEGLATYVEGVERAQAHNRSPLDVWSEDVRSMPKGLPEPGDRGLDNTHTWGRTYWGGALFCLLADLRIREATGDRLGLEDALQAILRASGGLATDWPIGRVLTVGDRAVGTGVLEDLYAEMKDQPVTTDLPRLWRRLGIVPDGASVTLRDDAPLAAERAAILRPRAQARSPR